MSEVLRRQNADAAAGVAAIDRRATAFSASFEGVLLAVAAFKTDCRLTHVRALKDAAGALLADAAELDRLVD